MTTLYKFLSAGAVGPISGFVWPAGDWVEAEGALELCRRGAHLCRVEDLAHWVSDELWQAEAEGELVEGYDCVLARRARLVRQIDAWKDGGAAQFAQASADHARELAVGAAAVARRRAEMYANDAAMYLGLGMHSVSAFCAAVAVAKLGEVAEEESAYRRERVWQAGWMVRRFSLT